MPIEGKFWTSQELQNLLGVSKQRIAGIARDHGWHSPRPGLYAGGVWEDSQTVDAYLSARHRKDIMQVNHLVWHDDYDLLANCPECGQFALIWPDDDHYKCVSGHYGRIPDPDE